MTPSPSLRPVLVGLAGLMSLATTSCGLVEGEPRRFENLAESVAAIQLDPDVREERAVAASTPAYVSAEAVANPGNLRIEVMDPHALWDARDAGLRGAIEQAGPALIDAAVPVVADAMARPASAETPAPRAPGTITTRASAPTTAQPAERTTLQLGAFSSPAAAREAWTRIAAAGGSVAALSPRFESVDVDGRTLTRLKVVTPVEAARAVCRAADAAQLGCLRRG